MKTSLISRGKCNDTQASGSSSSNSANSATIQAGKPKDSISHITEDDLTPFNGPPESTRPQPEKSTAKTDSRPQATSALHARIKDLELENTRLRQCLENQKKITNEALAREKKAIEANKELWNCLGPLRKKEPQLEVSEEVAALVQEQVAKQLEGLRH
jgi:hypothetical protein